MKPPFGQDQMQQMHQRQLQGAFWEQQQRKKRETEDKRRKEAERFIRAQREAEALRRRLEAGRIGDADFGEAMRKLAFQDEAGDWWSVGAEYGDWHRYDGSAWVRQSPPCLTPGEIPPTLRGKMTDEARRHPFRAVFQFLLSFAAMGALGFGAAITAEEIRLPVEPGAVAIGGLILAFLVAVMRARRSYHGR